MVNTGKHRLLFNYFSKLIIRCTALKLHLFSVCPFLVNLVVDQDLWQNEAVRS